MFSLARKTATVNAAVKTPLPLPALRATTIYTHGNTFLQTCPLLRLRTVARIFLLSFPPVSKKIATRSSPIRYVRSTKRKIWASIFLENTRIIVVIIITRSPAYFSRLRYPGIRIRSILSLLIDVARGKRESDRIYVYIHIFSRIGVRAGTMSAIDLYH